MRRQGQQTAWQEDEEVEYKQSLHQKEAITAQMIGIISSRLDALQTIANNRKYGLECDLKVNSDYCSKMVPGLQDPYENRTIGSNKTKASNGAAANNHQVMMERLFGPEDKTRLRTQVLKKNKIEMQKNEHRKNARVQLEKQLQSSIEGHITRTVESYTYGVPVIINDSDATISGIGALTTSVVHVNSKLLLLHTCERMRILQGKRNFKKFLHSEVSCTLFEQVFWLCFCHFFQKDSMEHQHALIDEISSKYVKMVATLHGNVDYIFRMYPYAVSSAVCWGFYFLFPGSRHLYTNDFKNDVFVFVCQLLQGLKLCPVSVQIMRKQLFPDEAFEDLNGRLKQQQHRQQLQQQQQQRQILGLTGSASAAVLLGMDAAMLPRISTAPAAIGLSSMQKSTSESYLGRQSTSDNTIEKILGGESQDDVVPSRSIASRAHQQRTFFNASQLSPLMKEYFGSETKNLKKPCFLLRTTPFSSCPVGGEDTYHKYYRRRPHKNHALESMKEQEKCIKDLQRLHHETKQSLAVLDETREIVLGSGKKALQAYCTMLISQKNATRADDAK